MAVRRETRGAVPTGVVTFLMTDVEDSTRLWEAAPEAMASAIDRHYELLSEAIERHGGSQPIEQVGREGDSVVGAFVHASDALAAALEAQLALRAERWPAGAELRVRMALHSGEARLHDESAIIRCARLRSLCPGGQIALSGAARELVLDAIPAGATLGDLGQHPLKGIERPERVYALIHPELDGRWKLPSPAHNLPSELTRFVGREREVTEIAGALADARLLTLTGPGGAGKTRLALRVAAHCSGLFPDGIWWAELAPVRDSASMVEALAGVLGVRPSPGRTPVQVIIGRLAENRALVILDNCEHLIGAAADLAEALLRGCPNVVVLVTSRERLTVPGESEWPVPPLSLPSQSELETPEVVVASDAGSLFIERAVRVRPDFTLGPGNAPGVARICRELDGIPLAIELAAARVRMLSVEQIASQLGDRFRVLASGPRGVESRQRTLRGSVDWSYDLLCALERLLFRRLAVFVGGWSLDAVTAVCRGNGLEEGAILDLLGSLISKSLVVAEHRGSLVRYRMLETVRLYAVELCADGGEAARLRDRHFEFFLSLAERAAAELDVPRNREWLDVLEPEAANLSAAIDHGITADPQRALRISVALTAWWEVTGRFSAAESSLERALAAADPSPSPLRARALWTRGHFAHYVKAETVAGGLFEQAFALAETTGDESTQARTLRAKGLRRMLRDPVGARADLSRAFELARSAGDAWALMSAAQSLAWSYAFTDEFEEAERLCDQARRALERLGIRSGTWAPLALAYIALVRADHDRCVELCQQALSAAHELGDPVNESFAQAVWAWDETTRGRADAALTRALEAEARVMTTSGMAMPLVREQEARAHAALGHLGRALELLELVVASARDHWDTSRALSTLGDVRRVLGDAQRAEACAREALELSQRMGARSHSAGACELLGRLAAGRDEWSEADRFAHEALAQRVEVGVLVALPQTFDLLALTAAGLESHTEATRLLGVAERARADFDVVRWTPDVPTFEALEHQLEQRLGPEPYAAARTEGSGMSLDEAIGWVRRARGSRKRPSGGWEALTPTELQVVQLVSEGLTNPQVAQRMFISRATVKAHLTHIFQKLDVRSRAELAALAARRAAPI